MQFSDTTPMPFGKYLGTAMANVPAKYLLWLFDQGCSHAGVRKYIIDNLQILQREAGKYRR